MKDLVRFLHAAAGFPVRSMWLASIRAGNYATWPGLTYENSKIFHPTTAETPKVHMTQNHQGVRSTKRKSTPFNPTQEVSPLSNNITATASNELCVVFEPVIKLYTDDMGRFAIHSCSGHGYIMIAFHCNSNTILIQPFQSCHECHHIEA